MSDLHKPTIREVLELIADVDSESPSCPVSADMAYPAIDRDYDYQVYVLSEIARVTSEPWAQEVANRWLIDNGL
jgi:hypothetical protein